MRGEALADADFQGGADVVHYRVKELPTGSYHVVAALLYQTIGARFARDLFLTQGAAVI